MTLEKGSMCLTPFRRKKSSLSEIPNFDQGGTLTNWVKRLLANKKCQKSNIILEGSRYPNIIHPFEYGKSFHNKSFLKRIEALTPPNRFLDMLK